MQTILLTLISLALTVLCFFLAIFAAPLLIDGGMNSWLASGIAVCSLSILVIGFLPLMDYIDRLMIRATRTIKAVVFNSKRPAALNGLILFGTLYFIVISSFAFHGLSSLFHYKQFLPWVTLFIGLGIPLFPSLMLSYLNEQKNAAYERGATYGYKNGRKRGELAAKHEQAIKPLRAALKQADRNICHSKFITSELLKIQDKELNS